MKPEDWDEREKIPDPEDKKPEGWDDIPATIVDPDAKKPGAPLMLSFCVGCILGYRPQRMVAFGVKPQRIGHRVCCQPVRACAWGSKQQADRQQETQLCCCVGLAGDWQAAAVAGRAFAQTAALGRVSRVCVRGQHDCSCCSNPPDRCWLPGVSADAAPAVVPRPCCCCCSSPVQRTGMMRMMASGRPPPSPTLSTRASGRPRCEHRSALWGRRGGGQHSRRAAHSQEDQLVVLWQQCGNIPSVHRAVLAQKQQGVGVGARCSDVLRRGD